MTNNPKYVENAYFAKEGYIYTAAVDSLAAGAIANVSVSINTDADFYILKSTYWANESATDDPTRFELPSPGILVQIQDTASGNQLFRQPLPLASVFGTGSNPFIWPAPYGVAGGGALEFTFENITNATVYENVFLNLVGMKAFRQSR